MNRFVVMVDAGYLLHKSVEIVSRRVSAERRDLEINDAPALVQLLTEKTRSALGLHGKELLRVYWYDGVMAGGLTSQQRAICELPDVSFRAGMVNSKGQQKGVDSLIVTDLFELASNRAVADAALVTGDSDLAVGIELAQKKGVRIAVIGLEDLAVGVSSGQSREITDRADRTIRFGSDLLAPIMRFVPRTRTHGPSGLERTSAAESSPAAAGRTKAVVHAALGASEKSAIDSAVKAFIAENSPPKSAVDAGTNRIEASLDRALIHHVYASLGRGALGSMEKIHARASFRAFLGRDL